jgi:hypothetical protein
MRKLTKSPGFQSAHRVWCWNAWKAESGVLPANQLFKVRPATAPRAFAGFFLQAVSQRGPAGMLKNTISAIERREQATLADLPQRRFGNKIVTSLKIEHMETFARKSGSQSLKVFTRAPATCQEFDWKRKNNHGATTSQTRKNTPTGPAGRS